MYVENLSISNFRNFTTQQIEFSSGVNVLHGNNGSGKTNLLEAVFVVCLGRSHRNSADLVMINKESDCYRLEADITADKKYQIASAFQKGARKKITIDGVTVKTSELYDIFCVVSAGPEDSEILSGAPSVRRTFMDIYLSQKSKNYLDQLTKYQKVLMQKNAALKKDIELFPFNTLLAQHGAEIMFYRTHFLEEVSRLASKFYNVISSGGQMKMQYKPSINIDGVPADKNQLAEEFEKILIGATDKERIMQNSMYGTHRDDIYFEIEGFPARHHGSQGEWRTAAISLKLAVYHILKQQKNSNPILLLDEIFAELDDNRVEGLVNTFGGFGQLFLTTASEPPGIFLDQCQRYEIDNGQVVDIK